MAFPTFSIIIPTYNGEQTLPELLAMLSVQTVTALEIIVVDSSSNDQSRTIAKERGIKLIQIDKDQFDHGGTRSMAASRAQGEIVVFFTQDAIPAAKDSIETLIQPFIEDEEIAVSYGRQLPAFDATLLASHLRTFNYPTESSLRSFADRKQLGLKTIFVSNSFAAYKKTVLEDVGFFKNGLIFGEDTCTVGRILKANHKIAYVAEACVYHSHNYTILEEFRRYFDIGVLHSEEHWLLETYGTAEGRGVAFIRSEMSLLFKESKFFLLPLSIIKNLIKLIAYKSGRKHFLIPKRLIMLLSMHKTWWKGRK